MTIQATSSGHIWWAPGMRLNNQLLQSIKKMIYLLCINVVIMVNTKILSTVINPTENKLKRNDSADNHLNSLFHVFFLL